jgi:hypothetical protein
LILTSLSVQSASASLTRTSTSLSSRTVPSTYGQSVTFVATVKPVPPNGEKISFYNGNVLIGTNTLSGGSAFITNSTLPAGSFLITATYPGDASLASSTSGTLLQTVRRASPFTLLTSSLSASTYGQPVTLNAKVPANVPNGESVTFYDKTTPIGTSVIASGVASFTTCAIAAGIHSLTAQYPGDANYTQSTSNTLALTVKLAPTYLTLNSLIVTGNVTLMATISSPYNAVPNGETITFKDGAKILNATQISSGTATLTSQSLYFGIHAITATYAGDSNFVSSTSQLLTLNPNNRTNIGGCGFALNVSSGSPYYVVPQKITIYYTLKSFGGCSPSATGTISLSSASTGEVYASIPVNITSIISTPVTRVVYANSSGAPEGPNLAIALINTGTISNLSSASFDVLQTANLSIRNTSMNAGNVVRVGSPLYVTTRVLNNAFITAYNATLNLEITAPDLSVYRLVQPVGKIRLFQNLSTVLNPGTGAIPMLQGKYLMAENVSFFSNYSSGKVSYSSGLLHSNTSAFTYVAYLNKNSGYNISSGYPPPVPQVGPAVVNSFPYYTDFLSAAQFNMSDIAFYNSAPYPITVNLSATNFTLGMMAFTHNSISLQPNQQGSTHVIFAPVKNMNFSTYIFPINVSVSWMNGTASKQLDAILVPQYVGSALGVLSRVTMLNGNRSADTQLTVFNPTNVTNYGLSLYASLNSSLTGSSNNIAPSGPITSIPSSKGAYALVWSLGNLQGHSSTQVSYNTSNIIAPAYLVDPLTFLTSTTQSNLTALSILGITVPKQGYTNNTYNISVSAIYTGTNATAINFTLTSTGDGKVLNPKQSFTVTPYSTVYASFVVKTGAYPGNETFSLNSPGVSTVPTQHLTLSVALPPVQIPTIYDYINDPRTIFGVLTFSVSAVAVLGGRISRMNKERQMRHRSTVKKLDALTRLDKKINVAIFKEDGRERTFRRQINKDGSVGGFAEATAMVGSDVTVAQTAIVEGSAIISGTARIADNARVAGHAVIRENVVVAGNASVGDNAELYGDARLSGNAKAFGNCQIYDNARVYDSAEVFGNARIYGEAQIFGRAKVYSTAQISGTARIRRANVSKGNIVSGTR